MKTRPDHFATLLRQATGRRELDPLLRALGFEPRLARVPPAAHRAYGLAGERGLHALVIAGERDGLLALLLELRDADSPGETARLARRLRAHNPVRPLFLLFAGPRYRRLGFASFGTGGELRQLLVDRSRPRRSDAETLEELAAREGEGGVELLHRHARALDRTRLTRQFFRDFRAQRDRIAAGWTGLPAGSKAERDQLALLFLCRLLFLYFLQKPGYLNGDPAYLPGVYRRWRARPGAGTFFRALLGPLFFGALNTRPERRAPEARSLGPLPYLNGGLFERHALERRFPDLDLEDTMVAGCFEDLLERYRFTTREAAEAAADEMAEMGVDPEMLGRVFEELMAADRREASGTFFTPAGVVDRLVQGALETWLRHSSPDPAATRRLVRQGEVGALTRAEREQLTARLTGLRVLDPACGSGAFLLGALSRIARTRAALEGAPPSAYRREIVARSLHGVDLQDDAALLCALRLWLALTLSGEAGTPEPLPNLDRKIRQGDALLDPLDLLGATGADGAIGSTTGAGGSTDAAAAASRLPGVRRTLRAIAPLATRYLSAEPGERPALQRELAAAEIALARGWLAALHQRLTAEAAELRLAASTPDLFGELPPSAPLAESARRALEARVAEVDRLRQALEESGALPFFSFEIHFADADGRGFDLILSNPPWIRAHRWPAGLGKVVRQRYAVCRDAGWHQGALLAGTPAAAGAQVDLSLLFLERSLRLLAPHGVLAMLLPAKAVRSLYGGGGRRLLLRETRLDSLEDHSLDQRSIFRADAFTVAVVAQRYAAALEGGPAAFEDGPNAVEGGPATTTSPTGPELARRPTPAATADPAPGVRITMIRRGVQPLRFAVPQDELPVLPGDLEAPWLIAPPAVRAAIRKMQAAGPPLGAVPGLRVRRGIATGANDIFLLPDVEPKLGGLAWVRAEGYDRARRAGRPAAEARRYEGFVEGEVLRPLVRGSGIAAWRFQTDTHLLWLHDDLSAAPREAPPRTARYLARHDALLRARSGWRPTIPAGAIFRATPATTGPKVAWQDLASDLEAVALPARVRGPAGGDVPLIPLNTVYFIPTTTPEEALLLAALFNSLPVRTFARTIAERAKDARFRFFAWTIALLPLPAAWQCGPLAAELLRISEAAHLLGGLAPAAAHRLDTLVGSLYGLGAAELAALTEFDHWLKGRPNGRAIPAAAGDQ